jgi:putative ABC transport system ATP-binding protein
MQQAHGSGSPVVSVNALSFAIAGRTILHNLNFSRERGEHLLLLGPSGAGKTSLINLITGLASPTGGRVSIAGEIISQLPGARRDVLRRRTIGVIFQSLRLVSALSVRGNLQLAQHLAGLKPDRKRIEQLLDAVGIGQRASAKPRQLSQGEAQRAAIARALITRPLLLVADEPTSALDDANAAKIAELLLATANQQGSTLLIATHDQRLKSYFPDSLALPALTAAV